ncbi:MAG: NAD(P)H-hydrate epimerase [Actinomycetota bacterium]
MAEAGRASFPAVSETDIAWLGTADMVEVDRVMVDDLEIHLVQMMENAGRNLARLTLDLVAPSTAVVAVGTGGNGGGGLAAARHLANAGVAVTVCTTRTVAAMGDVTAHQFAIVEGLPISLADDPPPADVFVDALIGYSLVGPPRGRAAALIEASTGYRQVISLDAPSGLDTATGTVPGVAVAATATLTLAAPKVGLRGHPLVGDLYVADISVPPGVIECFGPAPRFADGPILRVLPTRGLGGRASGPSAEVEPMGRPPVRMRGLNGPPQRRRPAARSPRRRRPGHRER